jgi:hypothetical protein
MMKADPLCVMATKPKLEALNEKWMSLNDKLEAKLAALTVARQEAEEIGEHADKWSFWLNEVDALLSQRRPTGGLPETARTQVIEY